MASQGRNYVNFFAEGGGGQGEGYVNLGSFIPDNIRTLAKALQKQSS